MPEASQKVAETAEITKTAPKPSQKAGKDLAKSSCNFKNPKNSSKNPAVKPHKNGLIDMY